MVKLRLKRIGKKQAPFYRIVAADSRINRNGKYIELIGTFDPLKNEIKIDKEIALKWLKNGAQPTDTVRGLFSEQGLMTELHNDKVAAKKAQPKKDKPAKKTAPKAKPAAKKPAAKKAAAKPAAAPKADEEAK